MLRKSDGTPIVSASLYDWPDGVRGPRRQAAQSQRPTTGGLEKDAGRRQAVVVLSPNDDAAAPRVVARQPALKIRAIGYSNEIRTPRDIGRYARHRRRTLMLRQNQVAEAVGVSRQWIGALEDGKTTLELGLVLRAFETLGIDLTAKPTDLPPDWTVRPTFEAEQREWASINRRRRKRMEARCDERRAREDAAQAAATPAPVRRSRKKEKPPYDY